MSEVTRIFSAIGSEGGGAALAVGLQSAARLGRQEAGSGETRPDAGAHGPGARLVIVKAVGIKRHNELWIGDERIEL